MNATLIKTRREETANYSSVFFNGKTIRNPIDSTKPITELKYPEFYDVSLGNKCETGKCPWCVIGSSLVKTIDGDLPIEQIHSGQLVYTSNEGNRALHPVSQIHKRLYDGELILIEMENGNTMSITPNHKVCTKTRGWIEAENLFLTDEIVSFV